jgi:hypothetical protein
MQTASLMLAELSTGPGKTLSAILLPPYWILKSCHAAIFNTVYA